MKLETIKQAQKKTSDELQEYLQFKRRGSITKAKQRKEKALLVESLSIKIFLKILNFYYIIYIES